MNNFVLKVKNNNKTIRKYSKTFESNNVKNAFTQVFEQFPKLKNNNYSVILANNGKNYKFKKNPYNLYTTKILYGGKNVQITRPNNIKAKNVKDAVRTLLKKSPELRKKKYTIKLKQNGGKVYRYEVKSNRFLSQTHYNTVDKNQASIYGRPLALPIVGSSTHVKKSQKSNKSTKSRKEPNELGYKTRHLTFGNPYMDLIPPSLGFGGPMHTLLVGYDDFIILKPIVIQYLLGTAREAALKDKLSPFTAKKMNKEIKERFIGLVLEMYMKGSSLSIAGLDPEDQAKIFNDSKLFFCFPPLFVPAEFKGDSINSPQSGGAVLAYSRKIAAFIFRPAIEHLEKKYKDHFTQLIRIHRLLIQKIIRIPKFEIDMDDLYDNKPKSSVYLEIKTMNNEIETKRGDTVEMLNINNNYDKLYQLKKDRAGDPVTVADYEKIRDGKESTKASSKAKKVTKGLRPEGELRPEGNLRPDADDDLGQDADRRSDGDDSDMPADPPARQASPHAKPVRQTSTRTDPVRKTSQDPPQPKYKITPRSTSGAEAAAAAAAAAAATAAGNLGPRTETDEQSAARVQVEEEGDGSGDGSKKGVEFEGIKDGDVDEGNYIDRRPTVGGQPPPLTVSDIVERDSKKKGYLFRMKKLIRTGLKFNHDTGEPNEDLEFSELINSAFLTDLATTKDTGYIIYLVRPPGADFDEDEDKWYDNYVPSQQSDIIQFRYNDKAIPFRYIGPDTPVHKNNTITTRLDFRISDSHDMGYWLSVNNLRPLSKDQGKVISIWKQTNADTTEEPPQWIEQSFDDVYLQMKRAFNTGFTANILPFNIKSKATQ